MTKSDWETMRDHLERELGYEYIDTDEEAKAGLKKAIEGLNEAIDAKEGDDGGM